MGRINVLDKFTAEKIAAGEVVERPASVVKELIENPIDAGAKSVTVEIKRGGITYMRVTDSGCGMDSEDAKIAFLRHATSKIKTDKDLEGINTLGFRGEALCSIAAVSRTELFTKQTGEDEGTHILIEGGQEIKAEAAGCPEGTTIVVRDLFYNTPARMKFLKKDASEAAAVADVCNKQALSHPQISVRFIRDGKEILMTPGDNILKNAVHCVLGRDIAQNMTEVSYKKGGITVSGLTGKNNLSRPNRMMEIFFVNGRCVANKTLYNALAEAYKNELMIGRFPAAVLNISLDASLVDVNVHPSKTEIKFASEQEVYEALYWAVKEALQKNAAPREVFAPASEKASYKLPFVQEKPQQTSLGALASQEQKNVKSSKFVPYEVQSTPAPEKPPSVNEIREAVRPYGGKLPVKPVEGTEKSGETAAPEVMQTKPHSPETPQSTVVEDESFRIIGQLFSTYILVEKNGEFIICDQHAAHERIRYEEIKENGNKAESQILLMPISVTLTPAEKTLLQQNAEFFGGLGFETEDFGGNEIVIRSLPADCPYEEGGDLLIEMLSVMGGDEKGEVSLKRDQAVYRVACRSAVKANNNLSVKELEEIYRRASMLEGISTCPHGRPISIKLTKYQIEKMFGRIV